MICDQIRLLEFADIHLCHRRTPTQHIVDNLNTLLPFNASMEKYDMIFIPGDVWDRLVTLPDKDVITAKLWIIRLLKLCKKYDIVLLVVEGTPSHDWEQSKWFKELNTTHEIGADLHYADTLSIVHFEKFGIDVLCVPDEWRHETDDTWQEVVQLLNHHGLEKVDFCAMHGAFSYQLPAHIPAPTHDMDRYLGITRYLIFIGHVHLYSQYERIFAAGSPDRLTHGEEGPKGILDATIQRNGDFEVVFIENENALLYKTFQCDQDTLGETYQYLEEKLRDLAPGSHVRIQARSDHPIMVSMRELIDTYPQFIFTTKREKEETVSQDTLSVLRQQYEPIEIHRRNISTLMMDKLMERSQDTQVIERAKELLDNYL